MRRPLYDVITERQKGDYLTGKYRYIAHFVERSYPTFLARSRPLTVPGGPIWATYLEKEAGKCPHVTYSYLGYPGPIPEKGLKSNNHSFADFPVAPPLRG